MPDGLLTSAQAGDLLGKSARTISRLAESGELTYSQKLPGPNGAYLFRRGDIDRYAEFMLAYVEARRIEPDPVPVTVTVPVEIGLLATMVSDLDQPEAWLANGNPRRTRVADLSALLDLIAEARR